MPRGWYFPYNVFIWICGHKTLRETLKICWLQQTESGYITRWWLCHLPTKRLLCPKVLGINMPFSKENWFHSFFLWSVWIFFTKLVQAHCTWRPNRLRDFPGEKLLLSRVSNWIKMGQNAIEDAILASFHIINIVKLSSRRGIYKNGMTTGLCSSTVVDSSSMVGVPLEL